MGDTVLHIASATKHATFVKKVVGLLTGKEELAQKNKCGDTAFCIAAESGIVTIAEEMWKKNEGLVVIHNKKKKGHHFKQQLCLDIETWSRNYYLRPLLKI